MDEKTYLERHFAPVKFNTLEEPDVEASSGPNPHPIEDAEGTEHRRSQGCLDARWFVGDLAFCASRQSLDEHKCAVKPAYESLEATKGVPHREPEAMYWKAVSVFEVSGDRDDLTGNRGPLLDKFPESEWAKKASYIRT